MARMARLTVNRPTKAVPVPDERLVRVLAFIAGHAAAQRTAVSSQSACDACVRLVAVSGAGVTLTTSVGRGEIRYATDEVSDSLESAQFTLGEGPGPDALRADAPVFVGELDSESSRRRWPLFAPVAVDAGVRAVFAFPLRIGAVRLGVLVLHRTTHGPLTSEQMADALVTTDVILSMLLDEVTSANGDRDGLSTGVIRLGRAEIHQATGMVSVQLEVSVEEALVRLRAYSFAQGRSIADVARDVVARRLPLSRTPEPDPG